MHELSIVVSMLEIVEAEAARQGADRVLAIHLRLGPLSGVVKEALTSAYEIARTGSKFSEAELVVEDTEVRVRCPECRADRPIVSLQELRCAACGAWSADVVGGKELEITALEIQ